MNPQEENNLSRLLASKEGGDPGEAYFRAFKRENRLRREALTGSTLTRFWRRMSSGEGQFTRKSVNVSSGSWSWQKLMGGSLIGSAAFAAMVVFWQSPTQEAGFDKSAAKAPANPPILLSAFESQDRIPVYAAEPIAMVDFSSPAPFGRSGFDSPRREF